MLEILLWAYNFMTSLLMRSCYILYNSELTKSMWNSALELMLYAIRMDFGSSGIIYRMYCINLS